MGRASQPDDICTECFGRVPYASLLALIVCWVGIGLYCSMMYSAMNASIRQATEVFNISLPFLDKVQLTFIVVATVMGFVALILLIIGALATGETRKTIYSDSWRARLGGRISCAIFLGVTYLLYLVWLAIFVITVALTFVYWTFSQLCQSNQECLDFSSFYPMFNGTKPGPGSQTNLKLCSSDLNKFCTLTDTAFPWYATAFFSCALILLGLKHFEICLAANYAHIKDELKYMELGSIIQMEDYNGMAPIGGGTDHRDPRF